MKTTITIEIEDGKEKKTIVTDVPEDQIEQKREELDEEVPEYSEEEIERINVASDLANVCEWLEEDEVIKLKLIIQKCNARRERAGE